MRNFLFALAAITAVACGGDPCQKAGDRSAAKLEECGIETTTTDDETVDVECTEALQALSECYADCTEAADCAAFDGSDVDAAVAYGECAADCAAA